MREQGTKYNPDEVKKKRENLKTYLRRLLKDDGKYKKSMSPMVELIALDMMHYRRIVERSCNEDIIIAELSREGNKRFKANPLENVRIWWSKRLQAELQALGFDGRELFETDDEGNDPLSRLIDSMQDE